MPHVVISNVIGTMMLLMVLGIVTVIGSALTLQYSTQTVQVGLQEVASYVSGQMVSMASLVDSSQKANVAAFKFLNLPASLGYTGYSVNVTNALLSSLDTPGWKVVAYMDSNHKVWAEAALNFQSGINVTLTGPSPYAFITLTQMIHSGQGGALGSTAAVIVLQIVNGTACISLGVSSLGRHV